MLDVIARVTPGDLARLGMAPGGCATLDPAALRPVLALSAASSHEYVGGSAANVARGLAQLLGGGVRFCGAVGNDDSGWRFRDRLQEQGVDVALAVCPDPSLPTARCGCLVTPDGQRTMRTCLGAAGGLTSLDHLPTRWLGHDATHLHVGERAPSCLLCHPVTLQQARTFLSQRATRCTGRRCCSVLCGRPRLAA